MSVDSVCTRFGQGGYLKSTSKENPKDQAELARNRHHLPQENQIQPAAWTEFQETQQPNLVIVHKMAVQSCFQCDSINIYNVLCADGVSAIPFLIVRLSH